MEALMFQANNLDKCKFTFTDGPLAGRALEGIASVCPSPHCTCQDVTIRIRTAITDDVNEAPSEISVVLDLIERNAPHKRNLVESRQFTQSFVESLTDDDWESVKNNQSL